MKTSISGSNTVGGKVKNRTNYIVLIVAVIGAFLFAIACFKKPPARTVRNNGVPVDLNVLLPRNVNNADRDEAALKESAVIISVPDEDAFYVGRDRYPQDDLRHEISKKLSTNPEPNRIVYFAGGVYVKYGTIVSVIDRIRMEDARQIGLLVEPASKKNDAPYRFLVQVLDPPDPNEDLASINPLTLVVSITGDRKLELNRQPTGAVEDTEVLGAFLSRIFKERKEDRAYKPGMETRTDLTEDERVEKTITIKAIKSANYGDIVRVVDAVKGAGANPIILQLDDLP